MGSRRTQLAETLGWAGSLGLHLTVALSAVGVIPIAAGLSALASGLEHLADEKDDRGAPDSEEEKGLRVPPPPPPPEPPPEPAAPKPERKEESVDVRVPEPEPPEPPELLEEELEPSEVTLGIDESEATDVETWLGFAEASPEHSGMVRGYEQAQLTRAPGERSARLDLDAGLGASDAPVSNDLDMESTPGESREVGDGGDDDETREGARERAAFVAAGAIPTITLARVERESDEATSVNAPGAGNPGAIASQAAAAVEQAQQALEALRKRGGEGVAVARPGGARPVDETARPPADAQPLESGGAGGEENAIGFLSDRDSDAAAIKQAISINPGKPLAAKGLRIQTVRPKWSTYTLATANPNDVVVRIWFDGTGRVTKAKIIQSGGRDDVDRPILDAVYNWRATGEQLSTIRNQPGGTVQLVFRIDLTG
jgi:TonB family protein